MIFAIIEAKYPANGTYPTLAAERVHVGRLLKDCLIGRVARWYLVQVNS